MTKKLYVSDKMFRDSLIEIIRQSIHDEWRPEVITGPNRGGLQMGVMLSHFFRVPFVALQWQTRDGEGRDHAGLNSFFEKYNEHKILLVDDINDTGKTLLDIFEHCPKYLHKNINVATLFHKTTSAYQDISYYAHELTPDNDPWVVFPYEEWWNQGAFE